MPPIQVHIDDPIAPKKADGTTPRTSESEAQSARDTTTTQDAYFPYPPAQPGAAAVPGPTPYAPLTPAQPTPTRNTTANYGPPPPQPGAVPIPPSQQPSTTTSSNPLPPPPKAGETAQHYGPVTTMPPQMSVPPPQLNYAPTHSTTYSPPETQRAAPTTLNFGAVPASHTAAGSHPPGYQQDTMAQEMSSAARASLDARERSEGFGQGSGLLGGLAGGGAGDGAGDAINTESMWNAVKGWASTAGKTLAETEKEVWKRINKE